MKEIIVKTQKELDEIDVNLEAQIYIEGGTPFNRIVVSKRFYFRVVAWGNSSVVARENSSVEAWGNSSVEAGGNSSVVAWENSSVEARGNSSVVAWGNVAVRIYNCFKVSLFGFSVAWKLNTGLKVEKKSKTATVLEPKYKDGEVEWLEKEGVENKSKVILYKKVSKDFKTQEGTGNETLWATGAKMEHESWTPEKEECGEGKFHACSKPYFCDEFRNNKGDRYVAVEIARKDLFAWKNPSYPHKIAFRVGTVLYEVDKFGKKI